MQGTGNREQGIDSCRGPLDELPMMRSHKSDPLVVLLLGPTGSGKTALSLALSERFGGEIVSCDSVAVYRGMDLGTAKPSREEQARVPHHLIDVVDPDETFTAGGAWPEGGGGAGG